MFINGDNGKICFEAGDMVCVSREYCKECCIIEEAFDPEDDHGINSYRLTSGGLIHEWEIDYDRSVVISSRYANNGTPLN